MEEIEDGEIDEKIYSTGLDASCQQRSYLMGTFNSPLKKWNTIFIEPTVCLVLRINQQYQIF